MNENGKTPTVQHKLIVQMCQVLLIWLVIVTIKLPVFSRGYIENEVDVLPSAKHAVEHNWLPNDWYLSLDSGYRHLFNTIFGPIISWLGFKYGALIGRLLIYFFLAVALHMFFSGISPASFA